MAPSGGDPNTHEWQDVADAIIATEPDPVNYGRALAHLVRSFRGATLLPAVMPSPDGSLHVCRGCDHMATTIERRDDGRVVGLHPWCRDHLPR